MVEVVPVETPTLGDRSYLAHDGDVALVVDPQRDIDRVRDLAAQLGARITHVAETHIHNDYVTGGLALAQAAGAGYLVNAAVRSALTGPRSGTGTACRSAARCGCGWWPRPDDSRRRQEVIPAGVRAAGPGCRPATGAGTHNEGPGGRDRPVCRRGYLRSASSMGYGS